MNAFLPKALGWTLHQVSHVSKRHAGDWALYFFARPRGRRYTDSETAYLAQADVAHQIDFKGRQITVYEWQPEAQHRVLLLHGWESNAARWQPLIKRLLAAGYGVVAPDAPAHGASEGKMLHMIRYSQLIAQVVEQWQPQTLIGHSLGGSAGCLYCTRHPETPLQQLIIMGVPSEFDQLADYYGNILGLSVRMRSILEQRFEARFQMTYEEVSVVGFCAQIDLPALVIHDEHDELSSANDARMYAEVLDDSELLITNGLGHSLQGEVVYQSILDYLSRRPVVPVAV